MQFRIPFFSRRSYYRLRQRLVGRPAYYVLGLLGVLLICYVLLFSAPFNFPVGAYIHVSSGSSLDSVAKTLQERGIIRSKLLFRTFVWALGSERYIIAGEYFFPSSENIFTVSSRLGSGDFQVEPARIRIAEGATVEEIGAILAKNIDGFDLAEFMREARGKEGYLFPDTYFFMPGQDTQAILGAFANNFSSHIAGVQKKIDAFGRSLSEVVTMASLLEREAPDTYDRRVIAGILWKRIKLGMPLQVDAVFPYIIGKNSFDLTRSDLKTDSPYNTYVNKGLPPGPIANPSLDAIVAAVTPIESNYLFYLSDRNGNFHYSTTYTQHLAAKNTYLAR